MKGCFSQFATKLRSNCNNTVENRKSVNCDKDMLITCYVAPEGSPLYNLADNKDGTLLLDEKVLHNITNKYI